MKEKQDVSLSFSHLHAPGTAAPAGKQHPLNAGSVENKVSSHSQCLTPSARASQHHSP